MMRMIDADDLDTEIVECSVINQAYLDGHHQPVMSRLAKAVYEMVREKIKNAPTVEAEPVVHARWEVAPVYGDYFWKCSRCKFPSEASAANLIYKYCPNCGAKMDAQETEE